MKLILLAATALIATPVIAQDTTAGQTGAPTTQTTPPAADPAQTGTPTDPATVPADAAAPAPATDPAMPMQNTAPMPAQGSTAPMTTGAGNPVGGYQPAGPAIQGSATPGGPVVFQQAPSPSQAYPAPAPKASYPICKKGQYDGCRQRGGK